MGLFHALGQYSSMLMNHTIDLSMMLASSGFRQSIFHLQYFACYDNQQFSKAFRYEKVSTYTLFR